jgi:hypothetical protein
LQCSAPAGYGSRPAITLLFRLPGKKLNTAFLDDDTVILEENNDREEVINSLCIDYSVWEPVIESLPTAEKFDLKKEMYLYARANLLRVNVYLRYDVQTSRMTLPTCRDPFVTKFVRDQETSLISFIANVGGTKLFAEGVISMMLQA